MCVCVCVHKHPSGCSAPYFRVACSVLARRLSPWRAAAAPWCASHHRLLALLCPRFAHRRHRAHAQMCKARGLPSSGTKEELVARLTAPETDERWVRGGAVSSAEVLCQVQRCCVHHGCGCWPPPQGHHSSGSLFGWFIVQAPGWNVRLHAYSQTRNHQGL